MKLGNDMSFDRIKIYDLLKANNKVVKYNDEILCIIIYDDISNDLKLGITNRGEYIFFDEGKSFLLNEKKKFLYCAKLLEIPYRTIREYIDIKLDKVVLEVDYKEFVIFPYYEIVEFALDNLINDYWVELVWRWYINFPDSQKVKLCDSLKKLVMTEKISQKNRNIAKKEIKRLDKNNL